MAMITIVAPHSQAQTDKSIRPAHDVLARSFDGGWMAHGWRPDLYLS